MVSVQGRSEMVSSMLGPGASARDWLDDISGHRVLRRSSTTASVTAAACLGLAASGIISWLGATGLPNGPQTQHDACARPEPGSEIPEPQELRSHDGVLELELPLHAQK